VSALLHAGIINLGGYLLLLTSPLMLQADIARWLVLVVAGSTCIIAALVMMTRVSVKVMLAWSTVAQMGLMHLETALGLYDLALLHLVGHSCYKAHCFLNAGSQVESYLREHLALPERRTPTLLRGRIALASLALALLVGVAGLIYQVQISSAFLLLMMFLVLFLERRGSQYAAEWPRLIAAAVLMMAAYALQKTLFGAFAPANAGFDAAATFWCCALFAALLYAYWLLRYHPKRPTARWLYRNLYAGFYLDEWATRATRRLWPVRLPGKERRKNLIGSTTAEMR